MVQVMSDLHVSRSQGFPPLAPGVDLVVVAGDVCEGLVKALDLLRAAYPSVEIAFVAGNHEFYSRTGLREEVVAGRERASSLGVSLIENDTVYFGKRLRVIGATYWTDYCLFGSHLQQAAMRTAATEMRDHKRIRWSRKPWRRFRPQEALALHLRSREYFEAELAQPLDGPTLLLVHHPMTRDALGADELAGRSLLSAAYASESPLPYNADYVVHGHTHRPVDFRRGRTRFVSNPRGYPGENVRFDPQFVLEIPDA
jgi:predicted phosphodiesterase